MDKIKFKFLNYKHHASFKNALQNDRISNDSIVFIQDTSSIWARGKEYVCGDKDYARVLQFISDANGGAQYFGIPYSTMGEDGTLEFRNGDDRTKFYIHMQNGTITLQDADRNSISATYILKKDFDQFKRDLNTTLEGIPTSYSYNDLTDRPTIPIVDSMLDENSPNAIRNSAVYAALQGKASTTELEDYATKGQLSTKADKSAFGDYTKTSDLTGLLGGKQDRLTAGNGITISNNVISASVDVNVYQVVDQLPTGNNINPNKIYLVPEEVDEETVYKQYKYDTTAQDWVPLGASMPSIDLTEYLKSRDAQLSYAPKAPANNPYVYESQLISLREDLQNLYQPIGDYITRTFADSAYQPKGSYLTSLDLTNGQYVTLPVLTTILSDYATKQDIRNLEQIYVKWLQVYTEDEGSNVEIPENPSQPGTGSGSGSGTSNITVDSELLLSSSNPVENRVIYNALNTKADKSALSSYATKQDLNNKADKSQLSGYVQTGTFNTELAKKQNVLTEGYGIDINENGEISVTLDTQPFVIVSELPAFNIDENKIYIVETENNGEYTYTEYRRKNGAWVEVGEKDINVDLSDYYTKSQSDTRYLIPQGTYLTPSEAQQAYQPKSNDYALKSEVARDYQEKGDYVNSDALEALRMYADNKFKEKGDYVLAGDVAQALITLQQIIDQKYVLKKDVYNPENTEFSTSDPTQISLSPSGNGGCSCHMITCTTEEYEALVANNMVNENAYYFTYEREKQTTWGFGDKFPVILIDGSTPDSIGTFPITLQ